MYDIAIWKVAADGMLLLALLYLGYRISRSEGAGSKLPRLLELEASLKHIIGEADQAGHGLSKQLQARQRDLEKLLYDMETAEQRLNRSVAVADERKGALEQEVTRARGIFNELGSVNVSAERMSASAPVRVEPRPEPAARPLVEREEVYTRAPIEAEPPSFEQRKQQPASRPAARSTGRTNIYGEPIQERTAPPPPAVNKSAPLRSQVEKTVQKSYPNSGSAKARMEDIYFAAEELLRAGKNIEFVAVRTRLPLEELKMLEQMVQRQRAMEQELEKVKPADDPRLGVLSPVNRQNQTV